ncbi:hypothetical protein BD413DRAFT_644615 [Trametes elegans]|nr:hypothetical protein BD413DRAFT_644615 [Trametes elegans]
MESLNLNNLASSLPSSSYANAEKELTNNFRAAALSLTTLYRSSKTASKRAYNAGYASACHDLLNMIQQGVSTDVDAGREVTIGRIMDYIEARLEAIKAREEEEDEEEERANRPGSSAPAPTSAPPPKQPKPQSPTLPPSRAPLAVPPTPYTPSSTDTSRASAPALASPTPAALPLRPVSAPLQRASKARLLPALINPKELPAPSSVPFTFDPPAVADVNVPALGEPPLTMPMKRRRESDAPAGAGAAGGDAPPPTSAPGAAGAGSSRRRTRSWRGPDQTAHAAHQPGAEAMDVEEEGPQRKRVARR